jgi:hypothetical protein
MSARLRYLGLDTPPVTTDLKAELEDEDEEPPLKKRSTRIKREMAKEEKETAPGLKCLNWRNTMALEELGHIHSDPPRVRKPTRKGVAQPAGSPAPEKKRKR